MKKFCITVTPRAAVASPMSTYIEAHDADGAVYHMLKAFEGMFLTGKYLSSVQVRQFGAPVSEDARYQLVLNGDGRYSAEGPTAKAG